MGRITLLSWGSGEPKGDLQGHNLQLRLTQSGQSLEVMKECSFFGDYLRKIAEIENFFLGIDQSLRIYFLDFPNQSLVAHPFHQIYYLKF
jgi:hypothetical protein